MKRASRFPGLRRLHQTCERVLECTADGNRCQTRRAPKEYLDTTTGTSVPLTFVGKARDAAGRVVMRNRNGARETTSRFP